MRTAGNKARTADVAVCPQCGRQSTAHGCRPVPLGWWCLAAGLQQDPATVIGPSTGPDPAATDPEVKRARSDEAEAQGAYDEAHAAWIDAVAAQRAVELKAQRSLALFTSDMSPILPDRNSGEQRELRDREAEARSAREAAAGRLVNARTATWAAETAARRGRT